MRLNRYFRRKRWDEERALEIEAHLAEEIDDNLARGMTPEEARRHAYVHLGNPTRLREEIWLMNSFPVLETIARDVRFACRQIGRSRWYALTVVITLGLGIGAITAIFSVLDAVLLEPLPFVHPEKLVAIHAVPDDTASMPTIQDWQSRSRTFDSIAAYRNWSPEIRTSMGAGGSLLEVSQNFLTTLGASFAVGHDLTQTGNERDCLQQAVLSGGLWKQMGGGSDLKGRTIEVDHRTFQIVGVLPIAQTIEGASVLHHPDIFVPIGCDSDAQVQNRGESDFWVLGRLRAGVSIQAAGADLARVTATLRKDYPHSYGGAWGRPPVITPWLTRLIGADTRPALLTILTACALLLLIACGNAANLMLARNVTRRHEFAVRAGLGASASQLFRQLLIENSLLVMIGSLMGIVIAGGAVHLLKEAKVLRVPRLEHASISVSVLLFAVGVAACMAALLTLLPAKRTLRAGLLLDLAGRGRASEGGSLRHTGRVLIAAQIAFSTVLVASAGWMVAGVYILLHQSLGFRPDHLLMVGVSIEHSSVLPTYNAAQAGAYYGQVLATLQRLPGVSAVAAAKNPPLGGAINRYDFCSDTHPEECRRASSTNPDSYDVSDGYFKTVGQAMLEGRDFTVEDNVGPHVVIVNRVLADREWPGQSAIGHRIMTGQLKGWATVIGVVENVHSYSLDTAPGRDLYLPMTYQPPAHMVFLLRTAGDPSGLAGTVQRALQSDHPDLLFYHVRTMEQEMSREVELRSTLMQIATSFGGLALLLAILGVYGLLSYEVSLRRKEVGIRMVLGASPRKVVRLLLQQESRWVLAGAGLGCLCAAVSGYAMRAEFYAASANAPLVLCGTMMMLVIPSLIAVGIPAWQVAQSDPAQTLRAE